MKNTIHFLKNRRSTTAKKMTVGVLKKNDLETILQIGLRVPDHGGLKPWKIKVIKGKLRKIIDEKVLLKEFVRINPYASEKSLKIESRKFQRANTIITVISSPVNHKKIPEWEQILSAGAVCANLLYASQVMGYAAQWLTEWYAYNTKLLKFLGINPKTEKVAGFIYIGKKIEIPKERTRPCIKEKVEIVNKK